MKRWLTSCKNPGWFAGLATAANLDILTFNLPVLSFAPDLIAWARPSGVLALSGVISLYLRTAASAAWAISCWNNEVPKWHQISVHKAPKTGDNINHLEELQRIIYPKNKGCEDLLWHGIPRLLCFLCPTPLQFRGPQHLIEPFNR